MAEKAIPRLGALYPQFKGREIAVELNGSVAEEKENQLALALAEPASSHGGGKRKMQTQVDNL